MIDRIKDMIPVEKPSAIQTPDGNAGESGVVISTHKGMLWRLDPWKGQLERLGPLPGTEAYAQMQQSKRRQEEAEQPDR